MSDFPPRDPSEQLHSAIYELDSEGNPWILAERNFTLPSALITVTAHPYSCRFCSFLSYRERYMINHLYDAHLNGR